MLEKGKKKKFRAESSLHIIWGVARAGSTFRASPLSTANRGQQSLSGLASRTSLLQARIRTSSISICTTSSSHKVPLQLRPPIPSSMKGNSLPRPAPSLILWCMISGMIKETDSVSIFLISTPLLAWLLIERSGLENATIASQKNHL